MLTSANWGRLLEPGLRFMFMQELENRASMSKLDQIYKVEQSVRSFEEAQGVGALSDKDWDFERTRRVQYDAPKINFLKTWNHHEFAKGILVERKLMDDNLYPGAPIPRKVGEKVNQLADSAFIVREKAAAEVFNGATVASGTSPLGFDYAGADGVALASNSHPLSPGSASVQDNLFALSLTADNYNTVRTAMRRFTDDNGNVVALSPDTLIVPPELEKDALVIMDSMGMPGTPNNDANVVGRSIRKLIVWDYLTDTNRWFLMDSILASRNVLWFDRIEPEFASEGDFDSIQAKYRAYMRFSRGVADWRCIAMSEAS